MYDIFLVSKSVINNEKWKSFKKSFPMSSKIENIKSFDQIKSRAFTKMFWVVWDDVLLDESFNLINYTVDLWDEKYIHCFLNGEYGFVGGPALFPRYSSITQQEFDKKYYENKKEINILASRPRTYSKFIIKNYSDYELALKTTETEMFWGQWDNLEITDKSIFSFLFTDEYNLNENHVFKNMFKGKSSYKNGLVLFSKNKPVSKREIEHKFLIEKKEHDITVSKIKPYDIIFISYNESNADENYKKLIERFPRAKRVDKVKGIHQAHIAAAELSTTEVFWVVDGDADIVKDFNFDYELEEWEMSFVHVWRSCNPINDLEYGYGGVKLLPRSLTIAMDVNSPDMTTAISKNFIVKNQVSNYTRFNTDPFSTWKSAFRECVKLASKIIPGQNNNETQHRLDIWKTVGGDRIFGNYSLVGARDGAEYGEKNRDDVNALNKINDFDWLRLRFEQSNL